LKAFLDACVLYPTVVREMLLGAAAAGLYEPKWSPRVLEEWARAAARTGYETEARSEIARLAQAWPRASVQPKAGDMGRLYLPDEDDVHVLAAAVAAGADLLITLNARDFPRHALTAEGLSRQDPDGFLRALWAEDPAALARVAAGVHGRAVAAGAEMDLRGLLKRARLPRLAKALAA